MDEARDYPGNYGELTTVTGPALDMCFRRAEMFSLILHVFKLESVKEVFGTMK